MSELWGEIHSVPDAESGIAELEREELTKPRALEPEAPPLFQPSSRHHPPSNEPLPAKWHRMDPVVMHTIRLIQHERKTRQAIQTLQVLQGEGKISEEGFPSVPPIPEYEGPPLKHVAQPPLMYMAPDFDSDFVQGKGERIPEIDEVTNRTLLRRSVAAILAHATFEGSTDSVLEIMTDVAHEFFLNLTNHLRSAADSAAMHGQSGFPDILEQVFHELGMGSVQSVHDFYQTSVLGYNRSMRTSCRQLLGELDKLKQPAPIAQSASSAAAVTTTAPVTQPATSAAAVTTTAPVTQRDTFNVIRIKEEPSADIQLPELDENCEVSEAEQLLQLNGLGSFEITVEHETSGGLTTDVESKWPQSVKVEQDKSKSVESSDEPVNVTDTSGSVGGQDSVPQTPRTPRDLISDPGADPGSVPTITIPSPPSPPPSSSAGASKPKKSEEDFGVGGHKFMVSLFGALKYCRAGRCVLL